jgi:molybdate transport system ATP-binding protein
MSVEIALVHRRGDFCLDVAFSLDTPGVTALFGLSGAGKTTVAQGVAGLLTPDRGRIVLSGRCLLDTSAGIAIPPRRRRIGYVFQDARLFPHLTVAANLRFGWRRSATRRDGDFDHVVALLGLADLLTRKPRGLSGGETGRVALGRALLSNPDLLICDEPLASLDQARKDDILPWFEKLRDEARLPILYITHSLDEVARLADQVVVLQRGRVAAAGRAFDLLPDLEWRKITGGEPAGAVFPAVIGTHDAADGLTALIFDGGTLLVPALSRPAGTGLRVRLRAEDVLLARDVPRAISANNVLSTTVRAVETVDGAHADVQLACGGVKIVSRITRASLLRLAIRPGETLYAIIKSVTVDSR